jgi:exosortase A
MSGSVVNALKRFPVLWLVAAAGLAICIVYASTFAEMASKWVTDASYQHGLVVPFISLWLVWRLRERLATVPLQPSWIGVIVLLALGVVWLVARAVDIRVLEQLAATAMIPAAVIALLGGQAGRVLAFPLCFLLLAVPVGQALVPVLMQITADFTVTALSASGIPVFRDGVYFSVPAGHFEVAKACSGVRYLSAAFTFGVLFAYLMLRTPSKRALFVVLSIVVPVIANGIRAYLIVLVATLSEMKYGVGVDHVIYGWVFFIPVIGLLLWIGLRMHRREALPLAAPAEAAPAKPPAYDSLISIRAAAVAVAIVAPPLLYASIGQPAVSTDPKVLDAVAALPIACAPWGALPATEPNWRPAFSNALADRAGEYVDATGDHVSAYRAVYGTEAHGSAEMIAARNQLETGGEERRTFSHERSVALPAGGSISIAEAIVGDPRREERLAWYWYDIGGSRTSSPYQAKALEVWFFLKGEAPLQRVTVISTPLFTESRSRAVVDEFLRTHAAALLAPSSGTASVACGG